MTQDIVGSRKGDYEILALLGVGGMGQVYKVRNVLSDRVEAMKILLPNLSDQKMLADRFIREIKVLAGLHHPNIAELRTALTIDNQLVMIMEYVEGTTLAARIQEGGLPYGRALMYIQQVLAALSYAHAKKIVHRDIKPSNMMLTPQGVVKLMDFGIARQDGDVALTVTHSTVGSIAYMSPEQVKGEPADARSDLYSVGVSLYELVTGQRPFQGDTGFSIMQAHLQTMPKPPIELRPELPVALSDLILMAVAKEPARRFQSADAFSRAIQSLMPQSEPTVAAMPVAPVSDPTVMAPPILGETQVAPNAAPFQATQVAAARPAAAGTASRTAAPIPAKSTSMPPPKPYRGFYIALGAGIVLVVLVAAGFYVPRHMRAMAAQQSGSSSNSSSSAAPTSSGDSGGSTSQPAATSSSASGNTSASTSPSSASEPSASNTESAKAAGSSSDAGSGSTTHVYVPPRNGAAQGSSDSAGSAQHVYVPPRNGAAQGASNSAGSTQQIYVPPRAGQGGAPSQNTAAGQTSASGASSGSTSTAQTETSSGAAAKSDSSSAVTLQQAETEVDQMSSRAGSVTSSLNSLRQQQSAQGLTLRGDMTAAEQRMQTNVNKAQAAVQAGDPAQAEHYLSLAEPDVEKLERFLGH
jgi:eukaryotic-like serine/threonine-protein kinase